MADDGHHEDSTPPKKQWPGSIRLKTCLLLAATFLVFLAAFFLVSPFLGPIAWALTFAVITNGLHERVVRRLRSPHLAAGAMVVLVTILIMAPALFVTQQVGKEASAGLEKLQEEDVLKSFEAYIKEHPALRILSARFNLERELAKFTSTATTKLPAVLGGSIWMATEALITLFILFFLFRDKRLALKAVRGVLPVSNRECNEIFRRVSNTIHATIFGTLAVAVIQGTLGGLIFWMLGLPAPLLWGVVMAFLAVLPILGAAIVWLPTAAYLGFQGDWRSALILTAWGSIVVGLIDNLLYPVLVGRRIREHTLLVFFAILGGLILFGASGFVVGPLILAVSDALLCIWRRRLA